MWLHVGDRDASDRYLAAAANDPRRSYWFFDCQVLQRQVMRDMLDGNWAAAADGIAEEQRMGGHDENIALSALAQTSWLRGETGDLETNYVSVRDYAAALPDFPILQALLVREAAESGRHDESVARLDTLAADDFAGVGRGWLTLMAVGNLSWAAITVGGARHAAALQEMSGLRDNRRDGQGTRARAVDRLRRPCGTRRQAPRSPTSRLPALARTAACVLDHSGPLHWWGRASASAATPARRRAVGQGAPIADELTARGRTTDRRSHADRP
jgi:hypothetical protein